MDAKQDKFELFEALSKFKWNIEFLGDQAEEKQFSVDQIIPIEVGDFFKFLTKEHDVITEVGCAKGKHKHMFDMPFFLCISPIWFVSRCTLYVTFVTGDKICGLRKVAFRFDGLATGEPKFFFSIDPSFDCDCKDCCSAKSGLCQTEKTGAYSLPKTERRYFMHSMGGGSGEIDV